MEMSMDDIKKNLWMRGPGGGSDGITHVEGYRHAEEIIKMAALMYTYAGCSFRSVAKAVEVINFVFPSLGLAELSHTSVRDWVRKIGLDVYRRRHEDMTVGEAYSIIMDERITVAEHKILLTLKAPAESPGGILSRSDVEVADIHVAASHRSEDVKAAVDRVTSKSGRAPRYAVTDNGRNLVKGLAEAGVMGHRDISHTFGTYLKAVYERDEEFVSLTKAVGNARHYALTDVDYLMPNNMRALARWMNVFDWTQWAKNMMEAAGSLTARERGMYSFVWEHGALVDELSEVMSCFRKVLTLCKESGLSRKTAMESVAVINQELMGRGGRLTRLGGMMIGYFATETALVGSDEEAHNVSSDIIESLFGGFKERKSPNRMYGVTGFILVMPLEISLSSLLKSRKVDFKAALERNRIADVKAWEKENLPENLAAKRARVLRQAC